MLEMSLGGKKMQGNVEEDRRRQIKGKEVRGELGKQETEKEGI